MRKLSFLLAFLLVSTFAFANNIVEKEISLESFETTSINNYTIDSSITFDMFDVCTVTVSIYQDGELVGSGTWTYNTGDCDKALKFATTLAFIEFELG